MKFIKLIIPIFFLSSCSRQKAFTSYIQNQYKFSDVQLKKVQFYISNEIILYQIKVESDADVYDGKLILRTEKDFEKIIIPRRTCCVLERIVDSNKFLISFEIGGPGAILFGYNTDGYYSLMAQDWKNKIGTLSYGSGVYVTRNGGVYLNVKARQLRKIKGRWRRLPGRRI